MSYIIFVIKGLIATVALYFRSSSTVAIMLAAAATYVSRPLLLGNIVPSIYQIEIEKERKRKSERERERERKKER